MSKIFQTRVAVIEDYPAARLRRIVLKPLVLGALPAYRAGQYAMLTFPGFSPRPFSIGNAPGHDFLEFHIRQTGGEASAYATTSLKVGDILDLTAPFGECQYVQDCNRPGIAVAGGSGLACMKAITEEALADQNRSAPFYLYFGARTAKDVYLDQTFRDLAETDSRFHYIPVLSEETISGYRQGLVGDVMAGDFPDLQGYRIYGAGPVEMMRHLTDLALAHGALEAHIHTDLQQPKTPAPESDTAR